MAFQPPSARQEMQNRKILEELQQHKKMLLKQQQSQPTSGSVVTTSVGMTQNTVSGIDSHVLTSNQRAALQHAHANSVGFFITQDSSFGNLILPVLPRYDK